VCPTKQEVSSQGISWASVKFHVGLCTLTVDLFIYLHIEYIFTHYIFKCFYINLLHTLSLCFMKDNISNRKNVINSLLLFKLIRPVSVLERSKASTVFGRSNIGITGSNPARGMDVCLRLSVLCSPV
jgi:hypothetical protein